MSKLVNFLSTRSLSWAVTCPYLVYSPVVKPCEDDRKMGEMANRR